MIFARMKNARSIKCKITCKMILPVSMSMTVFPYKLCAHTTCSHCLALLDQSFTRVLIHFLISLTLKKIMNSISRSIVISNLNMKTEENEISSDESIISGNSLDEQRFGNPSCNENKLPLKKRFGGKLPCFKCNWRLQTFLVKMQQKCLNTSKEENNILKKPEPKKATILPGVIRQTSCPDNTLAYYYYYYLMQ